MTIDADSLGRIAKLLIDRDDTSLAEAEDQLSRFRVVLRCGSEVAQSPTLQAAVLTAANVANRCFPGGVRVDGAVDVPVLVPWAPGRTFLGALGEVIGDSAQKVWTEEWNCALIVAFGTVADNRHGVQVTFDGWTCAVSPIEERLRLPEREGCILAGIAGGALAISEIFLGNFGCSIEAGSRLAGLSLWRPDLPWDAPEAAGVDVAVEHLPNEVWLLGLGHLGQAFAWSLSLLPFKESGDVNVILQDFDHVVRANLDTGLLSRPRDEGRLKTRVVNAFLEDRGFRPRMIERRYDHHTWPQRNDPRIVLAGMDGEGPRHLLDQTGFDLVVDCGVGGAVANFDSITLNVVPNPRIAAAELWPQNDEDANARRARNAKRLAESRNLYNVIRERQGCGHVELAGRSIAVPFVGAVASTLAISEVLRRIIGDMQYDRVRIQLSSPDQVTTLTSDGTQKRLRIPFQPAERRQSSINAGVSQGNQ